MTSMMISHKHYVTRLFSNRDYRVVDHRVSGVWGVPSVNGTQKAQKAQKSFFLKCDGLSGKDIRGGA